MSSCATTNQGLKITEEQLWKKDPKSLGSVVRSHIEDFLVIICSCGIWYNSTFDITVLR